MKITKQRLKEIIREETESLEQKIKHFTNNIGKKVSGTGYPGSTIAGPPSSSPDGKIFVPVKTSGPEPDLFEIDRLTIIEEKLTKQRLKEMIREEVGRIIAEGDYSSDDEKKASSILSRAIGIADQSLKAAGKMTLSHVSNLKPHEVEHLEAALVKAGLAQDEFDVDGGVPGDYSGSVSIYINQWSYPFCFDPDRGFYDC